MPNNYAHKCEETILTSLKCLASGSAIGLFVAGVVIAYDAAENNAMTGWDCFVFAFCSVLTGAAIVSAPASLIALWYLFLHMCSQVSAAIRNKD